MNESSRPDKRLRSGRRALLLAAAALAGAGGWWWRDRAEPTGPEQARADAKIRSEGQAELSAAPGSAAASAEAGAPADIWQLRFIKPEGGELAMATLRGRPLLLNFWGSWCPPCVAEMPELDRFAQEMAPAGWQVLGLAVDNPKAVREFLAKYPVRYHIALAGFEGAALTRQLGNSLGGLPFTVLFNARGEIVQRKAGQVSAEELQAWAAAL